MLPLDEVLAKSTKLPAEVDSPDPDAPETSEDWLETDEARR